MALYAWITPSDDLVAYTRKLQKLFTSMEVNTSFADTGKAYLVGLAATDDPASLGTEMLQFSASAKSNPLASQTEPGKPLYRRRRNADRVGRGPGRKTSLFARVTAMFTKKEQTDDARFSDVHRAVELVATEQQNLSERTDQSLSAQDKRLAELETSLQEQQAAFALEQQLSRKTAAKIIASARRAVTHRQAP
jgi:hypothetical protein